MREKAKILRKLVDRAIDGADKLPISEQIDLHQAAAIAFQSADREAARLAAHTARLLREADTHQLKFRELLKS